MFDRYLINADSIRNVQDENGNTTGYAFDVRIGYYRGLAISMVEPFDINMDGATVNPDDVTFTVSGQTFKYADMETRADVRWEMQDDATLTVAQEGGLSAGEHDLELREYLRISYNPTTAVCHDHKTVTLAT